MRSQHGEAIERQALFLGKNRGANRAAGRRKPRSPQNFERTIAVTPKAVDCKVVIEACRTHETEALHHGEACAIDDREILVWERFTDRPGPHRDQPLEPFPIARRRAAHQARTDRPLFGARGHSATSRFRSGHDQLILVRRDRQGFSSRVRFADRGHWPLRTRLRYRRRRSTTCRTGPGASTRRAALTRCRANMFGPRGFRQHSILITCDVGRLA